jgi:hypothetical protein
MSEISDDEIYVSLEYQQYLLILDEHAAYHYARGELMAKHEREALEPDSPPYQPSYQDYLQTPEWHQRQTRPGHASGAGARSVTRPTTSRHITARMTVSVTNCRTT